MNRSIDDIDSSLRLSDASRLECRICWYVYNPTEGDDLGQIQSGTPFSQLPDHWRCPQCDSGKEMFLPIED